MFSAYGLLLGQPSLCPTPHRPSWYLHLLRNNDTLLRFVTMVEIMVCAWEGGGGSRCMGGERAGEPSGRPCAPWPRWATLPSACHACWFPPSLHPCMQAPIFEMQFFEGFVRPSLHDAYTGWGEGLPVLVRFC